MSFAKALASIVSQMAQGTPIWKISAPASIHTDKSGLDITIQAVFSNHATLEMLNAVDSTDDPIERLALILSALMNPHHIWSPDKPYNPILGEFISGTTLIGTDLYSIDLEQINHHPPVVNFKVQGPTFSYSPVDGIDSTGGFKIGVNHVNISFPDSFIRMVTKTKGHFEWNYCGIKLDPIFLGGKRTAGYHGDIWIKDPSGISFVGKVTKPLCIKGSLLGADGSLLELVEGQMMDGGIMSKKSGKVWATPAAAKLFTMDISEAVSIHPKYSRNVWKKVFEAMRQNTPDFNTADAEKMIIENAQRRLTGVDFKSQFGFTCKYHAK